MSIETPQIAQISSKNSSMVKESPPIEINRAQTFSPRKAPNNPAAEDEKTGE